MCRDVHNTDLMYYKKMENIIDSKIIPCLQDCEYLTLNGNGEFFVNNSCKNLVKKTAVLYPKMQYHILTNGFLCTPQALQDLGIFDKRTTISLSSVETGS